MKILTTCVLILMLVGCSSSEEPIIEEEKFELEGKWVGTWNDNLFSSIAVSADIRKVAEGEYAGVWYIGSTGSNGPFTPCCGAVDNNGSVSFDVEGDNISNFVFKQVAPDYRGGCPGLYSGDGEVSGTSLRINFTGDDCDGFHDDGRLVWKNN